MTKELTVRNLYGIRGEITHRTDSNTIVITGKNRAGKSSFVNAFGHIFAHKAIKGAPDPVHEGQIEGEATYVDHDLGLSFTRKWKNGKMSAVEVRALDGAKYQDGTAILKERVGTVIVDVAEFLAMDEAKRRELIMSKSTFPEGFDMAALTAEQSRVEQARTDANREKSRLEGALSQLVPPSKETPDVEVSAADIVAEFERAREHNAALDVKMSELERAQSAYERADDEVDRLKAALEQAEMDATAAHLQSDNLMIAFKASPERIDTSAISDRLGEVEEINAKVRAKADHARAKAAYDAAAALHITLDEKLKTVKKAKFEGLALATFPHPGLSVDDEYVLLDGTPFVNVNAADREVAAIAVAISGEHSDEELCLVIIKNGDALDPTSLTKIDEMLTEAHFTGLIDRGRPDMPSVAGIDVLELEDGQVAK